MIVRAISNSGESLPESSLSKAAGVTRTTEFPLTKGASYPVFAVTMFLGIAWYYIINDDYLPWPVWAPSPLFEVADGRLPSSWKVGYFNFGRDNQYPIFSFPEWADDHAFYERLVDGDQDAVDVFDARRREVE